MAEQLKTTFEKYQFWAFTAMALALFGMMQNSTAELKKSNEELRREFSMQSQSIAVITTKLDSSEYSQKSVTLEIKDLNKRMSEMERASISHEQQIRQLSK